MNRIHRWKATTRPGPGVLVEVVNADEHDAVVAGLEKHIAELVEANGELDQRHSDHVFYTRKFKERIQKLLGTDEDNWFGLMDMLEARFNHVPSTTMDPSPEVEDGV